jgi:hypothetical protein
LKKLRKNKLRGSILMGHMMSGIPFRISKAIAGISIGAVTHG